MRQDKRRQRRKNDHSGVLALIILVVVFVGLAFLIASPPTIHSTGQSSAPPAGQPTLGDDAFYGSIENVQFAGPTAGVVKADTNCKPVEKGLTNCIGIITAADGAELHFNYTHDMSTQACLTAGDHVTVMLLSDGTARVVRG